MKDIKSIDSVNVEKIYNELFNVKEGEHYAYDNLFEGRKYQLSATPFCIDTENFPAISPCSPVMVLNDPLKESRLAKGAFQPEILLQPTIANPDYTLKGDINLALEQFLKLRPISSNYEVVSFLARYIGQKEVYIEIDKSESSGDSTEIVNFYTQPSVEEALEKIV